MSNSLSTLSVAQLKRAVTLKEKITKFERQLAALVGDEAGPGRRGRKKGQMSAAGRARIVAAQKARWAKIKAGKKG